MIVSVLNQVTAPAWHIYYTLPTCREFNCLNMAVTFLIFGPTTEYHLLGVLFASEPELSLPY